MEKEESKPQLQEHKKEFISWWNKGPHQSSPASQQYPDINSEEKNNNPADHKTVILITKDRITGVGTRVSKATLNVHG